MIAISAATRNAMMNDAPQSIRMTVTMGSTSFTLTNENIVQGSFSINRAITSGEGIEIGSCIASQLSFSAYETTRFSESASILVEIADGDEWVSLGTYYVDSISRNNGIVSIDALDGMILLDRTTPKTFLTWAKNKTVKAIVERICTDCGVSYNLTGYTDNTVISSIPESTYRQVLIWLLMISGKVGYFQDTFRVGFPQYNESSSAIVGQAIVGKAIVGGRSANRTIATTYEPTHRFNSSYDDATVGFDGVKWVNGETTYKIGSGSHIVDVSSNELVTEGMLPNILGNIMGVTYTPMQMEVVASPWIMPLDWVEYVDKDGTSYYGVVTSVTYRLNAHTEIVCSGMSDVSAESEITSLSPSASATMLNVKRIIASQIDVIANDLIIQAQNIEANTQQISLKVGSDGVISAINASPEEISIDASRINLTGYVTVTDLSASGTTEIDGARIATGYISADRINANSISVSKLTGSISNGAWKIDLDNGTMTLGKLAVGSITGSITNNGWGINFTNGTMSIGTLAVGSITGNIANGNWKLDFSNGTFSIGDISASNITAGTITGAVTATNLTMTGGSINVATSASSENAIKLSYGTAYIQMSPIGITVKSGDTFADTAFIRLLDKNNTEIVKLEYTTLYGGYVTVTGGGTERVQIRGGTGAIRLYDGTNDILISPSCNVATLQYTVVSTF